MREVQIYRNLFRTNVHTHQNMLRQVFLSLILLLCSPLCVHGKECYSEYWQQFFWKMWEKDPFRIGTYIKIDSGNDFKNVRSMQFNEQFQWRVSKNLALEVHYTYVHGRYVVPGSLWRWQRRVELEANGSFTLFGDCLVDTRNRLEIRRLQRDPKIRYRFRQRTMFIVPLEAKRIFKSFSVFNELFYNISIERVTEDRLCPFRLTFSLTDKVDMDLFFLIYFIDINSSWKKSAVFGTQFNF